MWLPLWNICLFLMGFSSSQVEDAKQPCVSITKHADDHLIDPDNLFVMGDSSGGHTALMCRATWNTIP